MSQHQHAEDLFNAILNCDAEAVILLAPRVIDLDFHRDQGFDESPLMLAARKDLPLIAFKALLERSDPRQRSPYGQSALMLAATGRLPHSPDLVRLLLPLSDPLAVDCEDDTALCSSIKHHAAFGQSSEIIALLLPVSDLNREDANGWTPLALAREVRCGDAIDLILREISRRESQELAFSLPQAKPAHSIAPRL